jgi:transcriptional regulator with XRE-family HTH domain
MSATAEHMATEFARPCLNLASLRERIGITFEEVAHSTRIAPHYLRAIEAEEFAKLPSGVYALSYIRQYARAVGYSETALLDHYRAQTKKETAEGAPLLIAVQPRPRPTTRFGEALGEAMELLHWRSPAKSRTHHPA